MKPLGDFLIAHLSAVLSLPSQKPQVALCCLTMAHLLDLQMRIAANAGVDGMELSA